MGVVVGLVGGAGLFCLWWSCWEQPERGRRRSRRHRTVQDLLVQAGAPTVTPAALYVLSIGLALVVLLLGLVLTRSPAIAACFAVMAVVAPEALVRARARRRRDDLREVWPDVVDHLASGVRAGLSLPEAVAQLGERGPQALREPFAQFAADHRATGRFGECLDLLKDRLADPVADRIIEALRLTREVGGTDLGRLLRSLSSFLRQDLQTRGELEARQSWTVNGARVAAAGPWVVLALLASRPETAQAYNSAAGVAVLLTGAACSVVAYRAMRRIGRLPEEGRVLR
ncbi:MULTISPECIES: type II secretion system F family protein [unclassified Isoptericola]|uniref:type II secretion system F family protein n=1 Tax=unclassified Isoptericola TaxID=2623355 RepID=UPI002713032B|nr:MULTISPECIES: type II secretion system F family protein [unclassified Isoptericola]MDO8144377.1 type II secretion system F family protein [Isoptericola sp. 178]MDO8148231.1 type II secretion system F family protein [Isoptericola sp. b515]